MPTQYEFTAARDVYFPVLGQRGRRASCRDFELEEDEDEVASLPAIRKPLITCHRPLSHGLHAGVVKAARTRRRNYRKGAEKEGGGGLGDCKRE